MKRYILSLLILTAPLMALSQGYSVTGNTIRWTANSFDNVSNSELVNQSSYFTTSSNKVEWVQSNGAKTYSFQIASTSGSWADVTVDGMIEFQVSIGSKSGSIKFYRENGVVRIFMNFVLEGKNIMPYKFHVQQIEKI